VVWGPFFGEGNGLMGKAFLKKRGGKLGNRWPIKKEVMAK